MQSIFLQYTNQWECQPCLLRRISLTGRCLLWLRSWRYKFRIRNSFCTNLTCFRLYNYGQDNQENFWIFFLPQIIQLARSIQSNMGCFGNWGWFNGLFESSSCCPVPVGLCPFTVQSCWAGLCSLCCSGRGVQMLCQGMCWEQALDCD